MGAVLQCGLADSGVTSLPFGGTVVENDESTGNVTNAGGDSGDAGQYGLFQRTLHPKKRGHQACRDALLGTIGEQTVIGGLFPVFRPQRNKHLEHYRNELQSPIGTQHRRSRILGCSVPLVIHIEGAGYSAIRYYFHDATAFLVIGPNQKYTIDYPEERTNKGTCRMYYNNLTHVAPGSKVTSDVVLYWVGENIPIGITFCGIVTNSEDPTNNKGYYMCNEVSLV